MNKEFEIKNNEVNVLTDTKGKVTRDFTNNIEDILICENNIEEIKNKIQYYLNQITVSKNKSVFYHSTISVALLWLNSCALSIYAGTVWLAVIQFLCSVTFLGFSIKYIKTNQKFIKSYESIVKELESNLENEKEKLSILNNDKTNDLINIQKDKKTIRSSIEIESLRRKLDIIYYYEMNKPKLINAYKNGTLLYYGLKNIDPYFTSSDEQTFLKNLIENDIEKNEKKHLGKQKALKRK